MHAVRHIVNQFLSTPGLEAHLLNVQSPFSQHIARFVSQKNRADYHREQGEKALRPCTQMLESFSVPYAAHIEVGDRAHAIVNAARRLRCDHIVMATARKNSLTRMIEDSTTNKVLELTTLPVEVIAGDAVSKAERYGIPVGIGTALAMLVFAAVD
jgi:nucleotide-binding universal stress UspA family protein